MPSMECLSYSVLFRLTAPEGSLSAPAPAPCAGANAEVLNLRREER